MSENEILKLLIKPSVDTNFPKLQPKYVTLLSKTITNILCTTSSNDVLQKAARHDILLLLQKWCCKDVGRHCNIHNENYDCYLTCMRSVVTEQKNIESKHDTDSTEIIDEGIFTTVANHFSVLEELNANKQNFLDVIRDRDKMKLRSTLFEANMPVQFSSNMNVIKDLEKEEGCSSKRKVVPIEDAVDPNLRQKRIKFLYALLNFEKVDETNLLNGLKELNSSENLHDYETEFVEYLWNHSGEYNVSDEIISMLLGKYSFLYEKPLIRMCTDALLDKPAKPHMDDHFVDDILKIAAKVPKIRHSIVSLVYELYACSGYSNKLNPLFSLLNM